MNIVQFVTWKSLWKNKKRTIVTILGVAICVSMLTAMSIIATSLQDVMLRSAIKSNGTMEIGISNVRFKTAENIAQDPMIKSLIRMGRVADSEVGKTHINLIAIDTTHPELVAIEVVKGALPKTSNEIALSQDFTNREKSYHVGDSISLPLYVEHYSETEDGAYETMREELGTKDYIISGIVTNYGVPNDSITNVNAFLKYDASMIQEDTIDIAFHLKSTKNFYEKCASIQKKYLTQEENLFLNNSYLACQGIDTYDLFHTFLPLILFLISIVLFGAVSLIYNAFSISLSERSRYLGMLSSVGATKRQKRQTVFFEAGMIGIIAIPLGLLAGIVGIWVTFVFLNPYVTSAIGVDNVSFEIRIDARLLVLTILFSILILIVSAWIPALRASRITAISAIQQHKDFRIRARNIKTSRFTSSIFGVEAQLGLKNMKRNRARYLSTLSSLVICIVLFMSAHYFSTIVGGTTDMLLQYTNADILMNFYPSETELIDMNEHAIQDIRKLPEVKKSVVYGESKQFVLEDLNTLDKKAKEYVDTHQDLVRMNYGSSENEDIQLRINIQVLSDLDFEAYCKQIGADARAFDGRDASMILVNKNTIEEMVDNQKTYNTMTMLDRKETDTLRCLSTSHMEDEAISFHLETVTDQVPSFEKNQNFNLEILLVCNTKSMQYVNDQLLAKGYSRASLFYEMQIIANDVFALQGKLDQIEATFPYTMSINNIAQQRSKNAQRNIFINTMLYGFVVLILLVCVANIMNSISTSMELRKREFAMIKSIGITKRKFYLMIAYETLFYGIKAILYGLPLGLLVVYGLYNTMMRGVFAFAFVIPWNIYACMIVGMMAVLSLTMCYSIRKIRHDNIVETIRKESI